MKSTLTKTLIQQSEINTQNTKQDNAKGGVLHTLSLNKPLGHKAIKTLADSIYETLTKEGCQHKDIIGVSSQLIGLVTSSLDLEKKDS